MTRDIPREPRLLPSDPERRISHVKTIAAAAIIGSSAAPAR
jgi:hypothetical protein